MTAVQGADRTAGQDVKRRSGQAAGPRALIVTSNFPPDASVGTMRTLRLVRHLAAEGWNVDVLTAAPEGFRHGTVVDPMLLDRVPPAVRAIRARALRPIERLSAALRRRTRPRTNAASRPSSAGVPRETPVARRRLSMLKAAATACLTLPDREVSWLIPALVRAWREVSPDRPDVIYSTGPPFTPHVVAAVLARVMGRPWVAEFRDPWARAPWREDRFTFERRAWQVLERAIVTRADAVVFATDANCRDFASYYGAAIASRFHVVPNGCDTSEFEGLVRRPDASGRFVLLHAGSLYGARNPAGLFQALARALASGALDARDVSVRFVGRTSGAGLDLPALVRDLGLDSIVQFADQMPRRAVLQEMVNASALLIVQPVTTVSIPAKLYEYMAAGRPILALAEPGGDTAELVQRSGAGIAVAAHDERAIEEALVTMVRGASGARPPVDPRAYDGALRAADVAAILWDLMPAPSRAPEPATTP